MSHVHQQQSFSHHQSPQRWTSPVRSSVTTSGAYSPTDARQRLNFGDRGETSATSPLRNPTSPRISNIYQGGPSMQSQQMGYSNRSMFPPQASSPTSPLRAESPYSSNRAQSSTSVNQTMNMGTMSTPSPVPNIEPNSIEYASKKTDEIMERDTHHPSLYQSLISDHTLATGNRPVSGLLTHDYPPVIEKGLLTQNLFTISHKTPVPAELNELLNQPDVGSCHMGLFPEICRAWMTIDSDLYLWDFRDGSDLSFYDGLKESIITMALVDVKKGIFQHPIRYLLVITTVSEIVILGFLMDPENSSVMELVPQPIFVLATEGSVYAVIHGTKQGRIFLGTTDGFIHEVRYQASRGWISDRCSKVNLTGPGWLQSFLPYKYFTSSPSADAILQIVVDNHRNLLFTRSSSGALQAFNMGDGNGFNKLGYISYEGIVNSVLSVSRKTLESTFTKKILCIAPIECGELNLVAVTDSGTRLYFSCYNPPSQVVKYPGYTATVFNLIHIRLPPGYCTSTTMKKPAAAQNAFYSNGVFSLSSHINQEQDCLWLITPFMYPSVCFSEVSSIHTLSGAALDIQAIPSPVLAGDLSPQVPDVVTQHLQWQREIVVLTPQGTIVYRASKPYELLKDLLTERLGPDHIKGHYELGISKDQPLANTVLLAIHPYYRLDNHVYDSAVKAFFMYGNNGQQTQGPSAQGYEAGRFGGPGGAVYDTTMDFNPNMVSTPSRENARPMTSPLLDQGQGYPSPPVAGPQSYGVHFQHQGATPQQSYQNQSPMYPQQQENFNWNFSPRHDAMYLVASRILAPFWNRPLVKMEKLSGPHSPQIMVSNIAPEEIAYAITFLQSIHKFITNNPSLYMTSTRHNSISMISMSANRPGVVTVQEVEKNAIAALKNFLSLTLEVFGMWKILCDHQFHIVLHGMEKHIENATMKEMVVTQHNVVSLIINALILKYLGDNAAVDAISLRLREVCPTLFRSEDAIGSKVAEMLSKVKNTKNHHEREALLKESLNLCEQICGHGRVNFRKFCQDYAELGYPSGFVRLCVTAAKAADPDQLAVAPIKSGAPSSDPAVEHAFQSRAEIYNIAFEILDNYTKISTIKQSPIAKSSSDESLSATTAQKYADETIQAILNCEDEVFHIGLYNWLVERKLFDRLLQIKHPYLDSFVQVTADAVMTGKWSTGGLPTDTGILDLLWRHHEKNQNHMAAAQILAKLAESTTTGLNLQQRLEYISRAIICAKSCYRRGDMLEHLEDKGDVARIQKFILDSIVSKFNSFSSPADSENISAEYKAYQDAIPKLNQQLYNITTLYTDFVEPFKLYEAKLDIFFSAGHGDKSIIETVWSDIVESELNSNLGQTMESQMEIIRRKLVTLGRKYINSPVFFPLEYLVEHLEAMKPTDAEHVGWVVRTMLEIGVKFPELITIYDKLWKKLTNTQQSGGAEVQIAKVIMFMIELFTKEDAEIQLTPTFRPEMLEECKNLTAAMIVEFSSRFDSTATHMTHQLNRVKEALDRCRF